MYCLACNQKEFQAYYHDKKYVYNLCDSCGLEWKENIPSQRVLNKIYEHGYFHQEADMGLERGYADYEMFENMYLKYFKTMIKRVNKLGIKRKTLVDIGCGPGVFLDIAKKNGYKPLGVDVSSEVMHMVKHKYNIKVLQGEFHDVKLPQNNLNIVTAFQTIEHVRNPLKLLQAIKSKLSDGGYVVMTTLNRDSIWRNILGRKWFSYLHNEHLHYWSEESLMRVFKRAGFEAIALFDDNWRWYNLDQIIINTRVYGKIPIPKLNSRRVKKITKAIEIPFPVGSIGIIARKPSQS